MVPIKRPNYNFPTIFVQMPLVIRVSVNGDGVATRGSMARLVWRCLNGRECSGTVELNHSLMDRAANL